MNRIVFATQNPHKVKEIRAILGDGFLVSGLQDISCHEDIPEPYMTLEENALAKARYVYNRFGIDCFADDTGLEVQVLNGLPGVQSARFAGEGKNSEDNIDKLLMLLWGIDNRRAQFRTMVALIIKGKEYLFEGKVKGSIALQRSGSNGFGYDSVFIPEGHSRSFAEMKDEEKNRLSHRYEAIRKMVAFLI